MASKPHRFAFIAANRQFRLYKNGKQVGKVLYAGQFTDRQFRLIAKTLARVHAGTDMEIDLGSGEWLAGFSARPQMSSQAGPRARYTLAYTRNEELLLWKNDVPLSGTDRYIGTLAPEQVASYAEIVARSLGRRAPQGSISDEGQVFRF